MSGFVRSSKNLFWSDCETELPRITEFFKNGESNAQEDGT